MLLRRALQQGDASVVVGADEALRDGCATGDAEPDARQLRCRPARGVHHGVEEIRVPEADRDVVAVDEFEDRVGIGGVRDDDGAPLNSMGKTLTPVPPVRNNGAIATSSVW